MLAKSQNFPQFSQFTQFSHSITALITPFSGGKIDEPAFEKIINHQIANGTSGIVPCGTTGESPTLTNSEHDRVIELAIEISAGRIPVMAGTGSNSTLEAIERTQHAEQAGADAALIMTPYYNKPTQQGIYQHFEAIHNASNIPLYIYNIPGRSVVDILDSTIAKLATLPRVRGIKDATADLSRVFSLKAALKTAQTGQDGGFSMLSGEDATAVEFNMLGGCGCISVTANIAPRILADMQDASLKGDVAKAKQLNDKLAPLHQLMFAETNPIPVKYAMSILGFCRDEVRLPLTKPTKTLQTKLQQLLTDFS